VTPVAVRSRIRFEGTVQGVGFRPHAYRVACELGLGGWVLNDEQGVLAEVEGTPEAVARFAERVRAAAPPLAIVERVTEAPCPARGESEFAIRSSPPSTGHLDAPVAPDSATCEECLRELFDPADRRHRYPFINCTNCGPRFTIVRGIPYDRPLTTMAGFVMCAACRKEYEDPGDRRFHAQPNACPACGPQVALLAADGTPVSRADHDDAMSAAAGWLIDGAVLAVKGIGGYHLACRADDELAVARLRARKQREDKPFALMVASLADAEDLIFLDESERRLLTSVARPIVLAPRRPDAPVAPSVAPGAPELGVMLAYTPLHALLLADTGLALVMTSGNISDEPIAFRDDDARERLAPIADAFLVHDRPIETRTDDSVLRVAAGAPRMLRRSRGFVPASLPLAPAAAQAILGCGAELKHTFCLGRGERAWVSHHIGDLRNYETLRSFADGVAHFERLFEAVPAVIGHDLHPDYLSTRYARDHGDLTLIPVQHHHAHFAGCLAEHGVSGPAVGAILDGSGHGLDGTVWGGEILIGDCRSFERSGHLFAVPLPGGDRAVREPWRMACAWLDAALDVDPAPLGGVDPRLWEPVLELSRRGVNSPLTSSAGRLFDAVAALCGVRTVVNYEGQAAIELEAACGEATAGAYEVGVSTGLVIDPRPAIRAVHDDVARGVQTGVIAQRFHAGLAAAVVEACARAASAYGLADVVLSGGVFQNRRLLGGCVEGLRDRGLRPLVPRALPVNDGGVSFGQVAVAAARLAAGDA
jgi:hydrogenase maturation protein HypF